MKAILFFSGILFGSLLASAAPATELSYTALQKPVLGELGYPLGKIIQVKGTFQAGDPRSKAEADHIYLHITEINQKKLPKALPIQVAFFEFQQTPRPKVGETVAYIGYETGAYQGIPSEAFQWMPAVATKNFHFATFFQVCKRL